MANEPERLIYWDSSVFLCLLNPAELQRRLICEDILRHARDGQGIRLFTCAYTIAEVIRPKSKDLPGVRRLTPDEIQLIQDMFQWPFLTVIDVDRRVAERAVELARDFELSPADSVHAAAAIIWDKHVIQHWERGGFTKLSELIDVENPKPISGPIMKL